MRYNWRFLAVSVVIGVTCMLLAQTALASVHSSKPHCALAFLNHTHVAHPVLHANAVDEVPLNHNHEHAIGFALHHHEATHPDGSHPAHHVHG